MYVSGPGISSPILVKVLPHYKVDTKLALKWAQCSNGNWVAIDRSSSSDTYETEITVAGKQGTVETFLDAIEDNRLTGATGPNVLALSGFEATEHIFGEDVDHTALSATVLDIGDVQQRSWQVYAVSVRLRAVSPSFTGSAILPAFNNVQVGFARALDMSINKLDTYYGVYAYEDHRSDTGQINVSLNLPIVDARNLRRYIATRRGENYTIANLAGVTHPWGITRPTTYPITAKLVDWADAGWFGINRRIISLKLAEVA